MLKKFAHIDNLVIVNTCCVTKEAEVKSCKKFRSALKKYPKDTIIATGCACRTSPDKFKQARLVIDNVQRNRLINGILPEPNKSRYFLKIEDGCTEKCTFCVVSRIREKIESKAFDDIVKEIKWAVSLGYNEIVLVGANIGLYGVDRGHNLVYLLSKLGNVPDLPRVRLSSIEPRFVTPELVACVKNIPFCRHFHIPIQSADNYVLAQMNRTYTTADLKRIVGLIAQNFDDVAIGGDVIVGFPGETETMFSNTYQFIATSAFTHLHVFPYSQRPDTPAYDLGDPVTRQEKKRRLWLLKKLIEERNYQFRKSLCGNCFNIITEKKSSQTTGLTDNYIRVTINGDHSGNQLLNVRITGVTHAETYGKVCSVTEDTCSHE